MGAAVAMIHMGSHSNGAKNKLEAHSASGSLKNLLNSEPKQLSNAVLSVTPGSSLEMQVLATTPDLGSQKLGMELSSLCSTSWGAGEPPYTLPQRATVPSQSHLDFTASPHLA